MIINYRVLGRDVTYMLQCQKRFGGKQEIATEDDETVAMLCAEWEAIMMHGLPCGKGKSRRLPMTKPRDNELGVLNCRMRNVGKINELKYCLPAGFWAVVKAHLSQSDLERIQSLQHVNTDIGYGRSWLRCSINERSLENYLHQILSNIPLLQ